jgi:hypothetical protein
VEHDDVVDPVEELGPEVLPDDLFDFPLDLFFAGLPGLRAISSKRMTEYGRRRTASVRRPPSS